MMRFNRRQLLWVLASFVVAGCAAPPTEQVRTEVVPAAESQAVTDTLAAEADDMAAEAKAVDTGEPPKAAKVEESEPVAADALEDQPLVTEIIPAVEAETIKEAEAAAPKPPPVAKRLPTDPNTFLITAGPKDGAHPFFRVGHTQGFSVNGEPGKQLVLVRGETYQFEVDTGVQHDFYFTTSPKGWGAGTVTDGITGQFTYKGTVTFTPGPATPNAVFYQCRNHKNMGGKIHVINKGETVKLDDEPARSMASGEPVFKVTPEQVKQKLAYGGLLVSSSEAAKRIAASTDQEARSLHSQAKAKLQKSRSALDAGDNEKALAAVDEALRLMNSAAQMVPAEAAVEVDYRARYDESVKEIKGYRKSYDKNRKQAGDKLTARLDEQKFSKLMSDANALAAKDDYQAALEPLNEASTMITAAISVMLDDTTVVYDKEFTSPQEEYEYELARYESYAELVPIAIEQRQPSPRQEQLMGQFVKKAEGIVDEGKGIAARGDYTTAIQAMQAATDNVKRALMLVGVR